MKQQDYQFSFITPVGSEEALEGIGDVSAWWAKKVEGSSHLLHDIFTVRFGDTFVRFEITERIPGKKLVWYVTNCFLHWQNDKHEWKGTSVVWEVEPAAEGTRVTMTHKGLVPEVECFEDCQRGWNDHVGNSLVKYLVENVGMPA
jgi:hypothetical protein